ncbi:MAG TPA: putative selenate reductase subunit YgfK [Exilispira sp.]|nr:putative selenate reductase subunit YgfK [Exilispira sp.]
MSEVMTPLGIDELIYSIFSEYNKNGSIFSISNNYFYKPSTKARFNFWGKNLDLPTGVAAGPHTQLAQNIIVSFLTGARFIELKTIQDNDDIQVDKPCIYAADEGYNVEWSTELKVEQALDEYIKAFLLIVVLQDILELKPEFKDKSFHIDDGFNFVASIGYSYQGIRSSKVDRFINEITGKGNRIKELSRELIEILNQPFCKKFVSKLGKDFPYEILEKISEESYPISQVFTLSTMHGTKPEEIETIIRYLFVEKKLNTILKVNPTLLGYQKVKSLLHSHGFGYIKLSEESFAHDLYLEKAFEIVERALEKAEERKLHFGIKVSNTLATINQTNMKGSMAYLSGRALFPISLEVAEIFRKKFKNLTISFSAGANQLNVKEILKNGIYPVTVVTDILKPGGYYRLYNIAKESDFKFSLKFKKFNASEISTGELYQKNHEHPFFPLEKKVVENKIPLFDCFLAPCVYSCPILQDVPLYLRFLEKKDYKNAILTIYSKNPLPYITSKICTHFCMYNCTRKFYDKSVLIRDQKLLASKKGYKFLKEYINQEKKNIKKNGIKVAIVGAGPAGLSAANFLARTGFDVTIFEKENKIGGIVFTTIPNFRIKKSEIDKDIQLLKIFDVKFENKYIEKVSSLKEQGFSYIIVATGADKSKELNLEYKEGEILDSIEFLRLFNEKKKINIGKEVVVIGGGNSAMDAARAAKRVRGVKNVTIVYRRTENELPADREEYENAIEDGISFRMLRQPISFKNNTLTCEIMQLSEKGNDGRRKSIPTGKYEILKADSIIVAIGEEIDSNWFNENGLNYNRSDKTVNAIDKEKKIIFKEDESIYIIGDSVNGPASVVEAIADARFAVNKILEKNNIEQDIFYNLPPIDNLKAIDEKSMIDKGKIKQEIKYDYKRCFECNLYCGRCVDVCPNRANRVIPYSNKSFKDYFQIIHIDYLCNECGNCETFCPYSGKPYKEKFTIFGSIENFNNSVNPGIFVLPYQNKEEIEFKIRDEKLKTLEIKAQKINNLFRSKENSPEVDFSLYLINYYPEIFKGNTKLSE